MYRRGPKGSFQVLGNRIVVLVQEETHDLLYQLKRQGGLLLAKRLVGLL